VYFVVVKRKKSVAKRCKAGPVGLLQSVFVTGWLPGG